MRVQPGTVTCECYGSLQWGRDRQVADSRMAPSDHQGPSCRSFNGAATVRSRIADDADGDIMPAGMV